jgi:hypothetical protein
MSVSPTSVFGSSDDEDIGVYGPSPPSVPAAQPSPTSPTVVIEPLGQRAAAPRMHIEVLSKRLHCLVPHGGHRSLAGLALAPERPRWHTGGFNDAGCTADVPHPALPRPAALGGIVPGDAGGGVMAAHDGGDMAAHEKVFATHDKVFDDDVPELFKEHLNDDVSGSKAVKRPRLVAPAAPESGACEAPPQGNVSGLAASSTTPWEFAPSRAGAPGRKTYATGSKGTVASTETSAELLATALTDYQQDKFAKASRESLAARLKWWADRAAAQSVQPYPLDVDKVTIMGALLKAGGYRAAAMYFSAAKRRHIELGFAWSEALEQEIKDGVRACTRNIGPPKKCGALDLQKIADLPDDERPATKGGQLWPRDGTIVGCWWAMREIELSTTRRRQIQFFEGGGCGSCEINLPVSKSDTQALGKRRRHGCSCGAGPPGSNSICPVAAARRLHVRAGALHTSLGNDPDDGALWPTATGGFGTKAMAANNFKALAELIGITTNITGHVCRVTGAQAMAVAGIEVWLIQAFCRWGSEAVLGYLRDSQLATTEQISGRVKEGLRLAEVRDELYQLVPGGTVHAATAEVVEEHLERHFGDEGSTGEAFAELKAEMLQAAARLTAVEAALLAGADRHYVANTDALSGKLHIARSRTATWCGWRWAGHPTAVAVAVRPEGADLCHKCTRNAPGDML